MLEELKLGLEKAIIKTKTVLTELGPPFCHRFWLQVII